jgi:large subunit ribosomal protein L21
MTYAIIQAGGKQYQVAVGDLIDIEQPGEKVAVGSSIVFTEVLLKDDGANMVMGSPFVDGARVEGEVVELGQRRKVAVMRFRAKSNTGGFRNKGHRQPYCRVRITAIH